MSPEPSTDLIAESEAKLAAGDLDGALAVLLRAVAAAPTSALAHSKLGIIYVHKRQWDAASAEFSKAIQLDPTYAPAYSNLGNVLRERGQLDQATAQYQKAISIDPEYWVAHQNLGIVYKQQGRVGEAVREFKTATRLSLRSRGTAYGEASGSAGTPRTGCLRSAAMIVLAAFTLALVRR